MHRKAYLKAKLKITSFNSSRPKVSNVFMLRIVEGNAFQRQGAADWNAQWPRVEL